ncbi:mannosyltransferase [Rhizoclosmatium globosum]|uniref:GPI mannosyltransferase 2 n=1 Tax=Rhizoclosmatium globosum TaxID=329046 RepID=A0A1Y2CY15_9FUNG|nr:mannosyltransferase [Rhizoclosmatium globosum]|eukprot:ORY51918.1 mannosyltransferase [Rhizoclosmatium globosum]
MRDEKRVAIIAIASRIAVVSSSILINLTPLKPYDTSGKFLGAWDAVYYQFIADSIHSEPYPFEQFHAFFPGLPFLTSCFSRLSGLTSIHIGLLISNIAFVGAAVILRRLTERVLHDQSVALGSAILFCLSPSAIFLSSLYTESLFSFLAFAGMFFHVEKRSWLASVAWMLAGFIRSNSIVFVGFFGYDWLYSIYVKQEFNVWKGIQTFLQCCLTASSFIAFQYYGYLSFCSDVSNFRPWCDSNPPVLYTFVQAEYWNNGFLKYWTFGQIPNFILAAPMLLTSSFGILSYFRYDSYRFLTLGLMPSKRIELESGFHSSSALSHAFLCFFLTIYCATCMHIQVITRFFTSLPFVYWYLAYCIIHPSKNENCGKTVLSWFLGYGAIGVVLFSLFYPPA